MLDGHKDFDIAIIGAGPAGSSAAITAARSGARVALLEASSFPRQKVCGEFVSAESIGLLRDLLRDTPAAQSALDGSPVIDALRLLFGGRSIQVPITPPGLSLPRYVLDDLLWQAAMQAGAYVFPNCEVRGVSGGGPFRVETSAGEVEASCVVEAAGRWSRFTNPKPVTHGPKWLGLKAHYREPQPSRSTDLYFFRLGYCGVQPIADDMVNVCAMVRSDRATSLQEVFALEPALSQRARSWKALTEPVSTAPLVYRVPLATRGNMLLIGDAAAFIDPFVGDGISIALRTGRLAAQQLQLCIAGAGPLSSAAAGYEAQYAQHFLPQINAASHIRTMLLWPRPVQKIVFEVLRTPGILTWFIRKTRNAN